LVNRFEETGKLEDRNAAGRTMRSEACSPCIAVKMEAIASKRLQRPAVVTRGSCADDWAYHHHLSAIFFVESQLYPYKLQSCHELLPADTAQRKHLRIGPSLKWNRIPPGFLTSCGQMKLIIASWNRFSSGRPRGTTPADDRYIVCQARRNRRQTAGEIARHRRLDDRYRVLPWPEDCTVVVCLHDALYGVPLTPAHGRRRYLCARNTGNGEKVNGDEYSLQMRADSVLSMILIAYSSGKRKPGAMGLQFLFKDDNAPCHRTVAAEQLLESEDIEIIYWPARYSGSQTHRACMGFSRQTFGSFVPYHQ
ncbi:hypothetical protein TNCV_1177181, partial [Trichonephila clavipes]